MRYQIPANTLPGARPSLGAHPYLIFFTAIIAGTLPGLLWAAFNAHVLGCTDKVRQWVVIGIGYCVIRALSLVNFLSRQTDDRSAEYTLLADVSRSLSYAGLIVIGIYVLDRQVTLFTLHKQSEDKPKYGWILAIAILSASIILTDLFMPRGSIGKFLWGGLNWGFL